MLSITDVFYLIRVVQSKHSALPISRGQFSPNHSRKVPIARAWGRNTCVFLEFEVWPKFYLRNCGVVCNNVLYSTAIYRESIVLCTWHCCRSWVSNCFRLVGIWRQDICSHPDDVGRMVHTRCSPMLWGLGIDINLLLVMLYTFSSFQSLKLEHMLCLFFYKTVFVNYPKVSSIHARLPEILDLYAQTLNTAIHHFYVWTLKHVP